MTKEETQRIKAQERINRAQRSVDDAARTTEAGEAAKSLDERVTSLEGKSDEMSSYLDRLPEVDKAAVVGAVQPFLEQLNARIEALEQAATNPPSTDPQ